MAGSHPPEGLGDDLFEQILVVQPGGYGSAGGGGGGGGGGQVVGSNMPLMGLQLGSSSGGGLRNDDTITMGLMPLGLNLEHHGFLRQQEDAGGALDNNSSSNNERDAVHMSTLSPAFGQLQTHSIRPALPPPPPQTRQEREAVHMSTLFPAFGQLQTYSVRPALPPPLPGLPQTHQPFHGQPTAGPASAVQHPLAIRQRVRARRGQATDPHSIAERLRRERIAGRMKALQELVPTTNKTDRAAMLDEIVEYVKFLRLQVKVLSMSRLGAAGAVAQLMADLPLASLEGEGVQGGANQQAAEKWSNDGTEEQVAKLMETDVGAAMHFLQSKSLCMMPISLASAIFQAHPPDTSSERGQA